MKKTTLLLLSSIFLIYGIQDAMSGGPVATPPTAKRTFDKAELQEEIDPNEGTSDATQRLEDVKRRKSELTVEITEKQKELQAVTKEEQEASRNAGTEGADRLRRKIAQHMDNIRNFDEQIKETTASQAVEVKRLKDEKDAQIRELTESNAAVLKELNDKKALSMAKKSAREQELAALKGAKASGPATSSQVQQSAAALQGTAAKKQKVNTIVEAQSTVAPQQVAAKSSGGLGGLFGGLQAIQSQVNQVTDTASKLSDTATGTIQNAASQVNGIKGQVADAQESIAGLVPSHSIKIESNGYSVKTISI